MRLVNWLNIIAYNPLMFSDNYKQYQVCLVSIVWSLFIPKHLPCFVAKLVQILLYGGYPIFLYDSKTCMHIKIMTFKLEILIHGATIVAQTSLLCVCFLMFSDVTHLPKIVFLGKAYILASRLNYCYCN